MARPWLRTMAFLVLIPGSVLVYVPMGIVWWAGLRPAGGAYWAGAAAYLLGVMMVLYCSGVFAAVGQGTPFPLDPPKRLVVRGPYRRLRNPMYSSIFMALLGVALVFASAAFLLYAVLVFASQAAFAWLYEEPRLRRRFGQEYVHYAEHVPRFVPRLRAYRR